jgi:CDP-2,3-bis-(O-geranylgeranyl)-sn-glycerol synthase
MRNRNPFRSNLNVGICCLLEVLECYIISIEAFIIPLLSAVWIMLPAYLPNPVAALCGGGTPVDLGRTMKDGRRVLGDGKTYRGFFFGVTAGLVAGIVQIYCSDAFSLTLLPAHTLTSVLLLSVGALLGDMAKSFIKRRLGKGRGENWPVADQYDLVAGAFLSLLLFDPGWLVANVTLPVFVLILILTPVLHRLVNIIGFRMGVKEVPW